MKVFLNPRHNLSQGIHRVARALRQYAPPDIQIVETPEEADLRIGHVVGQLGMQEWCSQGPYALIQYCLRTAEEHLSGTTFDPNSNPGLWYPIWRNARLTWSYYDLPSYIMESRGVGMDGIRFYHAPLGVDGTVFKPSQPPRKLFLIGTSGYVADSESVGECYRATSARSAMLFHLGPNLNLGAGVVYGNGMTDDILAAFWSQCSFVSGLRRFEGFELPALEGLVCGARPIMFDKPHYTQWFGEHAEYVPEVPSDELVDHLLELVSKPVRPVTPAERSLVVQTFDWKKIVTGFWEALR